MGTSVAPSSGLSRAGAEGRALAAVVESGSVESVVVPVVVSSTEVVVAEVAGPVVVESSLGG